MLRVPLRYYGGIVEVVVYREAKCNAGGPTADAFAPGQFTARPALIDAAEMEKAADGLLPPCRSPP
jgi:hypothetical protein